ncbi:MAG: L-arabinose isomerase, partial [Firmicutes bacterium]|nr:L-arabinose isomerase [Bacillota bacterium]
MQKNYEFWFVTGSQFLYGEETLRTVEADVKIIVDALNASGKLPWRLVNKTTVVTNQSAQDVVREANGDANCAGIVTFCHTFSPSKMWINGLSLL